MNNDLISISEAKKLGANCLARRNENGQLEAIISLDNAETVEYTFEEAFQKTVCENRLYCPARPQGETNSEIFKQTFGIYATELWSMKEADFLEWLNTERGKEE